MFDSFLLLNMENICDICGRKNVAGSNNCGLCGVDLRDDKSETPYHPKKTKSSRKKSVKNSDSDCQKITWCVIVAFMRSYEMTFPLFLLLNILFAEGKRDLGFCDCHVCNQGYREFYAQMENLGGKKKLKSSSREVVIKALETDIPSKIFHIPKFVTNTSKLYDDSTVETGKIPDANNKISIEIDAGVFENLILQVLSSERGHKLIRNCEHKNQ